MFLVLFIDPALGGRLPRDVVDTDDVAFVGTVYQQAMAQAAHGRLPLWFPEFDGGTPLAAAWMYGLLSPGLALFAFLPLGIAWAWTAALHAGLGAAGMTSFLRRRGCTVAAAVSGAFLYAVSELVVGRTSCGHLNLVLPLAWAPWVLRWIVGCAAGERRAVPLLALTSAAGLLAGHVQVWFYVGPLAALFAVAETRSSADVRGAARRIAAGAALALGIVTAQIAITAEYMAWAAPVPQIPEIIRDVSVPPGVLLSKFFSASLGPAPAPGSLDFRHEHRGIAGFWAFGLAVWGVLRGAPQRRLWAGLAVFGLVASIGTRSELTSWIQDVPPFSYARSPGRFLLLPLVAVPVLAAHGLDALPGAVLLRRGAAVAACALAVFLGLPSRGGFPIQPSVPDALWRQDVMPLLPRGMEEHRIHSPALYQLLNVERTGLRTLRTPCYVRTRGWSELLADPSPAVAWWVDCIADVEPEQWLGDSSNLLGIATVAATPFPVMGTARLFGTVRYGVPDDQALQIIRRGDRTLLVDGDPLEVVRSAAAEVRVAEFAPDRLHLVADATGPGWLLVSMKRYPGWTAEVDGAPAEIRRANLAFPAVHLAAAGRHDVVLTYRPWSFRIGAVVSLLALAATVLLVLRPGPVASRT